ncbi:MAG TPA: Ger(x)C family spore germination protein [Terriglobales bacterium]|nr:Ger(x)C family spore germination protein [Terriglobales bacterium]
MSKYMKFLIIGLATMVFTGVMAVGKDSKDINDKLIATTIAVDKKDGEFWFYVEFANVEAQQEGAQNGSGMGAKYFMVSAHGGTLTGARENLDQQLDRPIYMGGVRTLLIAENFAKEDLVEYLYRLRADESYRKKVFTVITNEEMEPLFKTLNEQGQSLGYSIENTITNLDNSGEAFSRTTSRLLENLSNDYSGILIPCIGLQDTYTVFNGYAVVNDTKVVAHIPVEIADGLSILRVEKSRQFYRIPCREYELTVEAVLTKRRIKPSYDDGKINMTVTLEFNAYLRYGNLKTPYGLTDKDEEKIERVLEEKITREVMGAVFQAQRAYKTDYLQFDDAFRAKYPVEFHSLDWNEAFSTIAVTPVVDVHFSADKSIDYMGIDYQLMKKD